MDFKAVSSVLVSALATMVFALSAEAAEKRYLVVLKGAANYQAVQQAVRQLEGFKQGKPLTISAWSDAARVALVKGSIERGLAKLNSYVMKGDEKEIEKLRSNPAVAMVEAEVFHPAPAPVNGFQLRRPQQARQQSMSRPFDVTGISNFLPGSRTPWGILAVKAPEAWAASHAGAGVRVLVLDTGIDKEHPSLAANFERGEDFVGDTQETSYPFADTIGHGTHVSGTIAGVIDGDGFTGVAPSAKLLMGRVCSRTGCSNISIATGVNWGIEQKVDLISMSLGGMMATPVERDAIGKAFRAGITIVAATGNDGTSRVSYPAALSEAIAVGAVDSKLQKAEFSQYGPEVAVVAPGVEVVSSVPAGSGREADVRFAVGEGASARVASITLEGSAELNVPLENQLMFVGLGRPEDFQGVDLQGKLALIGRGENKFADKVANAIAAGATGVVIFNNAPGMIHGSITQDGSKVSIPVFMIEQEPGERLRDALASQVVRARMAIVATSYSAFDGTSMATPHVSGVVALMKAANPKLTPAQIKSLLKSTATALGPNANNEYGSGLVNADAAVRAALDAPLESWPPAPAVTPEQPSTPTPAPETSPEPTPVPPVSPEPALP